MRYWLPTCRAQTQAALMDPKLTILFLLVGSVIGLSHLNEEKLGRWRRQLVVKNWREFVPSRRRG